MFTGMDVFSTQVVALRHKGPLRPEVKTLAEMLKENGYNTTCVGFGGNAASRGFDKYLEFPGWGSWNDGRSPKAQNLNDVTIPELERLAKKKKPFFLFLRHMDPHSPYLPPAPFERMFYHGNECDPNNHSMDPVMAFKPFCDFSPAGCPRASPTRITSSPSMTARSPIWMLHQDHLHHARSAGDHGRDHRRDQLGPRRNALRP